MTEKIKGIIGAFEWSWETKPRLFALGIFFGAGIMHFVNEKKHEFHEESILLLKKENEQIKLELKQSHQDCLGKIKEVKEFLKYIAE